MHFQALVTGFTLTVNTLMSIAEEDILPDIPEVLLRTVLIISPGDGRVHDLLDIEGGHFDGNIGDRQDIGYQPYRFDICIELIPDRGSQPILRIPPVKEPRLPVPSLAVSPESSVPSPLGIEFNYIGSELQV
jgi:hypothetical protein